MEQHRAPAPSLEQRFALSVGGLALSGTKSVLAPLRRRVVLSDVGVVAAAITVGLLISSRQSAWKIDPLVAVYGTPLIIASVWLLLLWLGGVYDDRTLGDSAQEVRRIAAATLYVFALVAGVSYLIRADVSRAYAFVSLPLGLLALGIARLFWKTWAYRRRIRGELLQSTVLVGDAHALEDLSRRLQEHPEAGYRIAGVVDWVPRTTTQISDWLGQINTDINSTGATAVAYVPSTSGGSDSVRELAWLLEGRAIDLLISSSAATLKGPRLTMRPAGGLPLLHLDEVALTRTQRFSKRALDICGSATAIVLLSPVMLTAAILVRLTSSGPVIFRQLRVGRGGKTFLMFKFRSMRRGADSEIDDLRFRHGEHGPMFKLDADPRITPVGRFLRRWSIDELPQLFNVLVGSMSLVGPRPHPLDDVDRYHEAAFRRLTLKPGMTGLWQVKGRSETPWAEAIELDLQYVEEWSLSTDLLLLARTVGVVARGQGAR